VNVTVVPGACRFGRLLVRLVTTSGSAVGAGVGVGVGLGVGAGGGGVDADVVCFTLNGTV
jgi:hypothetical protein